jgi:signal transduction histidine kinase
MSPDDTKGVTSTPAVRKRLAERDIWEHADLAWHGLFYGTLVLGGVLAVVHDPTPNYWLPAAGLVALVIAAHAALVLTIRKPGAELPIWRGLLALATATACVLTLLGMGYGEFGVAFYGLFPQAFILLGLRWGVVGAATIAVLLVLHAKGFEVGREDMSALVGSIVIAAAVGGFVYLVSQQSQRRREALEELAAARAQLDEAARREGMLAERQRVAGEVHDTVAQLMVGVVTQLEAARRALDNDGERARTHLDRAVAAARDGLTEIRGAVQALRPDREPAGLVGAIRELAARWSADTGTPAEVQVLSEPRPLPSEIQHAVLLAVREALANVARHAGARAVRLTVGASPERVTVRIADDGKGFDPRAGSDGFGLAAMRARMQRLGGTVTINTAPGAGTTVIVQVPA